MREQDLHIAVADYLAVALPAEAVFYHVPNGELRNKAVAAKLVKMGVKAGVPDFALIHDGRALFLEAKTDRGRLSVEQRIAHADLARAGGEVAVVRSVEDAVEVLASWGVPLRASVRA